MPALGDGYGLVPSGAYLSVSAVRTSTNFSWFDSGDYSSSTLRFKLKQLFGWSRCDEENRPSRFFL